MKVMRTLTVLTFITWSLGFADTANAQQLLSGEREARVTAIPNVIAANAKWELVWAGFETADGIVGTSDGGVLFAQEQTDTIRKLDVTGREFVYLTDTHASSRRRVRRLRSRFPGATRRRSTSRSSASSVRTENHGTQRVRNTVMSIYTIRMLAEGFNGRPK